MMSRNAPWAAPITADPARSFAAAFGEHALCLAAAGDPTSRGGAPSGPGEHADHDAAKCCQSHAAAGVVLPGEGSAIRIVFATTVVRFIAVDAAPSIRSFGRSWARAPPFTAA